MDQRSNVISLDAYRRRLLAEKPEPVAGDVSDVDALIAEMERLCIKEIEFWDSQESWPLSPYRNALTYLHKHWLKDESAKVETWMLLLARLLMAVCAKRQAVNLVQYGTVDECTFVPPGWRRGALPDYTSRATSRQFFEDMRTLTRKGLVEVESNHEHVSSTTKSFRDLVFRVTLRTGKIMRLRPDDYGRIRRSRTRKK